MQKRISSRIQARKMEHNKITRYFSRSATQKNVKLDDEIEPNNGYCSSSDDEEISIATDVSLHSPKNSTNSLADGNTRNTTPPNKTMQAGPLSPHKIQALNEEKLRLDVPHSPVVAFSKLKLISPNKLKFGHKKSAQRKHTSQLTTTELIDAKVPPEKTRKQVNGYVKHDPKASLRATQMTEYFPIRRSHRKPKTTLIKERQKEIEERILSNKEEGLKIKLFGNKGRGVVTTRTFLKGEMVVEYIGDLINPKEAKVREEKYAQDNSKGCYMYYFTYQNTQYCIDATEESPHLGRLVNHSRCGNLITKTVEVNGTPHLILVAKKDIEPGMELLYDYGDRSKQALHDHPWLAL